MKIKILLSSILLVLMTFSTGILAATDVEIQQAIDDGLAWLATMQDQNMLSPYYGSFGVSTSNYLVGKTAMAVKKFEHDAILKGYLSGFDPTYPYHDVVEAAWKFLFKYACIETPLAVQNHAGDMDDPDTDGDGAGIYFTTLPGDHIVYETGIVLMALTETATPDRVVEDSTSVVDGLTYYQIAVDVMNWLAYAQVDGGLGRGGWSYNACNNCTSGSDQSNSGYATLGLGICELPLPHGFGLTVPQFVKDELGDPGLWIDYIQNDASGGSGYTGPNSNISILETGNLLFEMAWYGDPLSATRAQNALGYFNTNFWSTALTVSNWPAGWLNTYQGAFTMMKGLEAYGVIMLNGKDWFDIVSDSLVAWQHPNGNWGPCTWDCWSGVGCDSVLCTTWSLLTLQKVSIAETCDTIKIEKTHDTYQGHYEYVSITMSGSELEMGGFDFLIAYDASALAFMEATPGQLLEDCGWEYFTYRYGVEGNCGDACPSGLLRIVAIAETNNGPYHPSCFGPPDTDPHELAKMRFYVSDDRTYEGMYIPIYFFWGDCGDNMVSSVSGDTVYIDRKIFTYQLDLIWDEEDDVQYPEDARIPFVGAPDYCLNPDPEKPTAIRRICFVYGGIDIIPADSIDLRCDLNLDNIAYTIADAVLYINYFIWGPPAFGINPNGSIAASDCNGDGRVLTIGDLVYLIRVITGDAFPLPKQTPYKYAASVNMKVNHSAAEVSANSPVDIGAAQFIIEYDGYKLDEPYLINGAGDMTLKYSDEVGVMKILVYSMEPDRKIAAGAENIFVVPIYGEGVMEMKEVNISDFYGNMLNTTISKGTVLPQKFALHQNYPNPFNATTQISYELPENAHVKIEIFNIMGQKVVTLLDDEEVAGVHNVEWNGRDQNDNDVASGIYLYRMTTDNSSIEKKMILMK